MTAKELFDQIVADIQLNNDVNYMPSRDLIVNVLENDKAGWVRTKSGMWFSFPGVTVEFSRNGFQQQVALEKDNEVIEQYTKIVCAEN